MPDTPASPVSPAPPVAEAWAWLDAGEGHRKYTGAGPFTECAAPPADRLAFYVNDFALSKAQPWRIPASECAADATPAAPPEMEWQQPDRGAFTEVFGEIMALVRTREILKAVPAASAQGVVHRGVPGDWLRTLFQQPRTPETQGIRFGWSSEAEGFGGFTPEILFALDGCRLTTMALAGTTDAEHAADLTARPKLAREHAVVVDELQRRLAALGTVKTGERKVVRQGNIRHLRTELEVSLASEPRGEALNDIIRLLHPTPALGISPRSEENMERLATLRAATGTPETFGAPFGVAWPGGALFVVAIRGMFWKSDRIHLPAGCGLVAGSELDAEWAELELKRAWVRRALGL